MIAQHFVNASPIFARSEIFGALTEAPAEFPFMFMHYHDVAVVCKSI